jgi:hypothetical protein
METLKEVTKEEFYNFIGPLDACISIENEYSYPYTSLWKLRGGNRLIGKTIDSYTDGIKNNYPIISRYYIIK